MSHTASASAAATESKVSGDTVPSSAHRSDGTANEPTASSSSSSPPALVLYDLTTAVGERKVFSPHTIKTVMGLRLLGVTYDRQRLTFVQVRSQLADRTGNDAVTVPTLQLSEGTYITDSWKIATYLAKEHPQGAKLFPRPPSSQAFAAALNAWGKTSMAPPLRPLTRPPISDHLEAESAAYFVDKKVGKANMDAFRALSDEQRQGYVQGCIDALEPIQDALAAVRAVRPGAGPCWLEGDDEPTHAEFCVYGWYGECDET